MFSAALRVLPIKDLKDLSLLGIGGDYRHAGPTDLKRFFYMNDRGGQAPALRFARPPPFIVGRGPVPRRASIGETALAGVRFHRSGTRGGQAPALR